MLTARFISSAKPGRHLDSQVKGLYLEVSPGGKGKRFVLRYSRPNGAGVTETSIGDASLISLSEARTRAFEFRRSLELGHVSPKRVTFSVLAKDVLAAKVISFKPGTTTGTQWKRFFDMAAPLNDKDVSAISITDVLAVLTPMWQTKPSSADRVRTAIEAVLDAAIVRGLRSQPNVARWKGTLSLLLPKRRALVKHHPAMPYSEVPAFMARMRETGGPVALAMQFTILTALRKGEVLNLLWSDIDGDVLTIPPERMKTGREHRVPLSPQALAIIEAQRALEMSGDFVFPNPLKGKRLSDGAFNDALTRWDCDFTVHGFRSSFRDFAGDMTDAARETAEACLAHSLGPVERAYRRGTAIEKMRKLLNEWANFICGH
ncbi:MAG: tyrosine-type recombinase/integrase [Roseiarcus sp.]